MKKGEKILQLKIMLNDIKPGYEIHHKDFNKLNNDISNLEELTPEEHQNKHLNRHGKYEN